MPALTMNVLGPLIAALDDQPVVDFRTNKVQALLVYLAVERARPHRREALMDLLWPDMPLESAQVNLRQTLYRLRQAIPEVGRKGGGTPVPLLTADRQTVQVNPAADVRLDVDAFQTALDTDPARAAHLYRGNFLSDFFLVDSNVFETWAETTREKLRRQILRVLDELTQTQLDRGNNDDAQTFAWKQLEIDPLREPTYRQLMLALANSGQRNAALAQYEMYQHRLNDDLGLEPAEETRQLYEQIQAGTQRPASSPPKKKKSAKTMPVFMLTDIEGSTQLWDTYHQAMLTALLRHNVILEEKIPRYGGRILELRGDGVKAVFEGGEPLASVLAIQKAFGENDWGEIGAVRIRIGLHGVPPVKKGVDYFEEDDKYYGPVLNHTARIMDAGWGGQILVSEQVQRALALPAGASWVDFGQQTLRSIDHPIHIFGLIHADLPLRAFPPLRTLSNQTPEPAPGIPASARPRHNLSSQPTPFVGRQRELAALDTLLENPAVRLVTLVGPGGMGKTRLACALAERQVERGTAGMVFPDGVFFVSLVSVSAPDQIIPLIAKTLNVPIEGSQTAEPMERAAQTATTPKEKLVGYLAGKRLLVVLDNFEHVIEGAEVISELLSASPTVQIVVTSRERLHIREEQVFPISGLDFPEWEAPDAPGEYTAMELFLLSARRVQPDFALEHGDMVSLTRVCRLVGGMPLGLELAASWVNMLSLQEIAAEIQNCFDFLETDLRNLPDRHRSIRAVFNSSWNRLNEAEKQLFARLSIFRGTFTREAAEGIARARLQTLANLAGKSLLQYDADNKRYQLHELLRQYGVEQLEANPQDEQETQFRHSDFYCREAEKHIQLSVIGQTQASMERFELDATNIRIAWNWAIEQGELSLVNEAVNGLCAYFDWSWRADEGIALCSAGLGMLSKSLSKEQDDPILFNRLHARLLIWQGYFNLYYRHDLATQAWEQAEALIDQLLEKVGKAREEKSQILFFRGVFNYMSGDLKLAKALITDALSLSREIGFQWMSLRNMMALGNIARTSGSPGEAKLWFTQCLVEARAQGNRSGEVTALNHLGWAARSLIAYQEAQGYYDQSIELAKLSNQQWELVRGLESSGFLFLFLGHFSQACERFSQAVSMSRELGLPYRTLPSQNHIGVAQWLSGDFVLAETALRDSLVLAQDLSPTSRIFSTVCLIEFLIITGRYGEANAQIRILNPMTQGVYIDRFDQGRIHRVLGLLALAEKKYPEARTQFEKSIELYRVNTDDEQVAWSQAGLAAVAIFQGEMDEAHQLLTEALWTCIEIQGFIPLLFALPVVSLYLTQHDPELARMVYAQSQQSHFLARAAFFRDIIYALLPKEILQSANTPKLPLPENDLRALLWATASQVLTVWLQVWREEPTLVETL